MPNKGDLRQKAATRIGNAVRKVEKMGVSAKPPTRPVRPQKGIPAKITQVLADGKYNLREQIRNAAGDGWEDLPNGRIWDGAAGNLPVAYEINNDEDIPQDVVVFVYYSSSSDSSSNQWYFDGGASGGGGFGTKTKVKHHIEVNPQKELQFVNDDSPVATDIARGTSLYGEFYPGLPFWRYNFDSVNDSNGYICPQWNRDNSTGTDLDPANGINTAHLRMNNLAGANGYLNTQIYHSVLENLANTNNRFNGLPNGSYWLDKTTIDGWNGDTSNATKDDIYQAVILAIIDYLGHAGEINGNEAQDDYETDIDTPNPGYGIEVDYTGSVYPSSGTLYDITVPQETRLTDGNGGDVTIVANNRIQWETLTAWGGVIQGALTGNDPINNTYLGDSTNYAAAKHGNDTDHDFNFARFFNTSFRMIAGDAVNLVTDATAVINTDKVFLQPPAFQSTPADGVDFNVWCSLTTDQAGATQYSRLNGLGEYQIDAYLYWASEGLDASTGKPNNILENLQEDVVSFNAASNSGAEFTFNTTIDTVNENDQLCVVYFLEFYNKAGAPPSVFGYCYENDGSFLTASDCTDVTGTSNFDFNIVLTPTITADTGTDNIQGGFDVRSLNTGINVEVIIDDSGAATTEFSDNNKNITIALKYSGTDQPYGLITGDSATAPVNSNTNTVIQINSSTIGNTDGYILDINSIEWNIPSDISLGEYEVIVTVQGLGTKTANFEITDQSGLFYWDDDFEESTLSTDRWSTTGTNTINSGILEQQLVSASGTVQADNLFTDGGRPDITSETWKFSADYTSLALPGNGAGTSTQVLRVGNTTLGASGLEHGYRNVNNGGQEYFIAANGTDLYSKSDTSTDTKVITARSQFTADDDFSGTGQNSASTTGVFGGRWTIATSTGSESVDTTNKSLDMSVASNQEVRVNNTLSIPPNDDFIIQVNLDPNTIPTSISSGFCQALLIVSIGGSSFSVVVGNFSGVGIGYSYDMQSSSSGDQGAVSTTKQSALLKLTRVSGTITADYEGNTFSFTGTHNGSGTASLRLISFSGGPAGDCKWSSFQVTSNGAEVFENRVLFTKGSTLKAVYDDSGADVDEVQLELDSDFSTTYTAKCKAFEFESPEGTRYSTTPP